MKFAAQSERYNPEQKSLLEETKILQHRVLHADETPVAMLKPGNGETHRSYLWAYAPGAIENMKAMVYDFCESRAGEHTRAFLGKWKGSLTCDDFSSYKALTASGGPGVLGPFNARCAHRRSPR